MAQTIPLGGASSSSSDTLAAKAATQTPLGGAASSSSSTLATSVFVPLSESTSTSSGVANIYAPVPITFTLDAAGSSSSGTALISATTSISLGGAASVSSDAVVVYGGSLQKLSQANSTSLGNCSISERSTIALASTSSISTDNMVVYSYWIAGAFSVSSMGTISLSTKTTIMPSLAASASESEANIGNPYVAAMYIFRTAANSVSTSSLAINPFVLLDGATSTSDIELRETILTDVPLQRTSSTSIAIAGLQAGFQPQVLQTYRISAAGTALGINGLSIAFAGSPILPQESFDVIAAISAAAAQGAIGGQITVCDNALKQALDSAPYVERVS